MRISYQGGQLTLDIGSEKDGPGGPKEFGRVRQFKSPCNTRALLRNLAYLVVREDPKKEHKN